MRSLTRWLPGVVWLMGCAGSQGGQLDLAALEAAMPDVGDVRVEAAVIQASSARVVVDLPGEVTGFKDVVLASAAGGLVEQVAVATGDTVRKGQLLVVVDREPRAAQADQAAAQKQLAESDLKRLVAMGDLATPAQVDAAEAQVAIATAQLRLARNQLDRATLRSPIDGVVAATDIDVGEFLAPGQPALRVVQLDPVKVGLSVSDRDLVVLEAGMVARVTTPAAAIQRDGVVRTIGSAADLSTRSFLVEVEVPNADHKLRPGMIAKVDIERSVGDGVVVLPQQWLVTRADGYGVFVIEEGEQTVARWRPVRLGQVARDQVVVESGLTPGDVVVSVGQHELVDGDRLLIVRRGTCCVDGRAVY